MYGRAHVGAHFRMRRASEVPALEVTGLGKRYGDFRALCDVTLRIEPGEIFALLGPNGAGKTTLIGSVCGMVSKSEGTIRVFGTDLAEDPVGPRFEIGLVPQEVSFDPFFTAREALEIQLGYYGRKKDPARIEEVLRALSLWEKADTIARALSGGMKRRLLIAKALVHKPKLLFLDEPTAGVDVELRRDLWDYVRRLRAEGTTIVLTTHYLEEAEELADRVGIIDRGRLLLVEEKGALIRRLGEKQVEVKFSGDVTALPPLLHDADARLSDDRRAVSWTERAGTAPSGDLLRALYNAGLPVAEVDTRSARLEDVLLQVLREQGPPDDCPPAT